MPKGRGRRLFQALKHLVLVVRVWRVRVSLWPAPASLPFRFGERALISPASSVVPVASCKSMLKVHIPTPLRQYAGKQPAIDVTGGTIKEALNDLISQYPNLQAHLYTDEGKLRAFVNVYLNDEDVRYMQKEATIVKDGDTISIVPSIAGGR
jgi:molybdopterin synthase sulfur carrier subunit